MPTTLFFVTFGENSFSCSELGTIYQCDASILRGINVDNENDIYQHESASNKKFSYCKITDAGKPAYKRECKLDNDGPLS